MCYARPLQLPGGQQPKMQGEAIGLQPGMTFEEWMAANNLTAPNLQGAGASDVRRFQKDLAPMIEGYRAYRALSGSPLGGELPPAPPPGSPRFSLRIDQEQRVGAGDLRIRP